MAVRIEMPLVIYHSFLGRCLLDSREYQILKNSVIGHVPEYLPDGNIVEFLCTIGDAKLILARARLFYPTAASYIEEGIRTASSVVAHIEYRRSVTGDTWHFCSNCSQWPSDEFLTLQNLPQTARICNECLVNKQHDDGS